MSGVVGPCRHECKLNTALDALEAAQARIAELEAQLAGAREAALERIESVRCANAGNFAREGDCWRGYDQACLDCYAALKGPTA